MYSQGHSKAVLKGHAARTVDNSAAFVVPLIKPTYKILDIGCGPGSIVSGHALHYDIQCERS
jgi:cyclopropane fatty-acyl-phospholipid synthase-like methyltransferase